MPLVGASTLYFGLGICRPYQGTLILHAYLRYRPRRYFSGRWRPLAFCVGHWALGKVE